MLFAQFDRDRQDMLMKTAKIMPWDPLWLIGENLEIFKKLFLFCNQLTTFFYYSFNKVIENFFHIFGISEEWNDRGVGNELTRRECLDTENWRLFCHGHSLWDVFTGNEASETINIEEWTQLVFFDPQIRTRLWTLLPWLWLSACCGVK